MFVIATPNYCATHTQAITLGVEISTETKVSGFGPLQGAVAILTTIASEAPEMLGSTALQRAKVQQWCGWGTSAEVLGANKEFLVQDTLASLNTHLAKAPLIAGHSVTIADLVCWAAVKPMLLLITHMVREKVPHVCRWFNYVQHKQGLESSPIFFNLNAINWRKTEH
jgi:glutathione S-transferase